MKNLLLLTALTFPIGIFAQGPNTNTNPPAQVQVQGRNTNNYIQINYDDNVVDQQANPPQQQSGGRGPIFSSNNSGSTPCTDCDNVKKAIKLSHASSGSGSHKKTPGLKKGMKKFSGRMNIKMKKAFARRYKAKPNHAICFNWH